MSNFDDVRLMREKFGLPNPDSLDESRILDDNWLDFRVALLLEEVEEIRVAMNNSNPEEILDGLIDLAVVCMGTAAGLGMNWEPAWDEVLSCNMAKERGNASATKRNYSLDLIKPEGWKAPDFDKILDSKIKTSSFSLARQIRRKKKSDWK